MLCSSPGFNLREWPFSTNTSANPLSLSPTTVKATSFVEAKLSCQSLFQRGSVSLHPSSASAPRSASSEAAGSSLPSQAWTTTMLHGKKIEDALNPDPNKSVDPRQLRADMRLAETANAEHRA